MNRRLLLTAALAAPAFAPGIGLAQSFPSRPISLLVPFPAGGSTDQQMRALARIASDVFGQQVITENRPGAGATLSAAAMVRAQPDGYTLAQFPLPAMRLPFMQRMPFNPRTDFTPIIHLTGYLFMMCVRGESPIRSWADLLAECRRRPGEIRWGNTGANGTPHLTLVELARRENLDVIHVPFRGEADSTPNLLGGHIEVAATGSGPLQMIADGRMRALNVWPRERSRKLPDVPTLVELGYPDMVVTSPYGLVGPRGMNPDIVRRLHDGFRQALHHPEHLALLERLDMPLEYLNSEDYGAFMQRTINEEEERVTRLGLRAG
ncbi:tripartite tricarboxylate transporter substrate binding protein [Roseomonas alkaliterrae]|uniref:Tripartite-type tricarboxylate transporter receptor subunit TctC n=1 Tax=Neoroseomonas alkaliterrae TaxID=1452450 RepID=A0A840Y8K9_9PROT|nr:tripartite tricarboxylate transporter substrate binding protein [Neoroseomonas alkaliterrae]MBB5690204.1 tripartite-type tricarboxylate transporter receptor subunit TctC [Neoroseomonas alkaliterrae]MBR0674792.1 tripartite tricarboxylate transporter substrate binding protein [Neoroseomonas alkaliterrae]